MVRVRGHRQPRLPPPRLCTNSVASTSAAKPGRCLATDPCCQATDARAGLLPQRRFVGPYPPGPGEGPGEGLGEGLTGDGVGLPPCRQQLFNKHASMMIGPQ